MQTKIPGSNLFKLLTFSFVVIILTQSNVINLVGMLIAPATNFVIADGDVYGPNGLIAAINTANSNGQANTIELAPGGTYTLITVNNSTFGMGDNGLPIITSDLAINGNSSTIQRNISATTPNFRLFFVASPQGSLKLSNLTIRNGKDISGGYGGGAIFSSNSPITITNTTFDNNYSSGPGGTIINSGQSNRNTLTIKNSTFSANSSDYHGGAIANYNINTETTSLAVTNSTFFGNYAARNGGAIYNAVSCCGIITETFTNTTFSSNVANNNLGNSIYNDDPRNGSITVQLRNSLLVSNSSPNCSSATNNTFAPGINNLEYPGSPTCGIGNSSLPNNPLATPVNLKNNGGLTQTIALAPAPNPAIDGGNPVYCPATDQRSIPRVGPCDIGAFEMVFPTINKVFATDTIILNNSTSLTFSLSNPDLRPLTNITFSDSLPAGLIVSSPNGVNSNCGGSVVAQELGNSIILTGGNLRIGGNCTINVNVLGTLGGIKNNITSAISSLESGPGATSNTATLKVCDPMVVDNSIDDNTLCGTLRYATLHAHAGDIIKLGSPSNFSLSSSLTVPAGVYIKGVCNAGKPAILVNGTSVAGDGLILSGRNTVVGLQIKGFSGSQVRATGNDNHLSCVIISRN